MRAAPVIRPATGDDAPFLTAMLAVAADWRAGVRPRPADELMAEPLFAHYITGWPREGDVGVVAEAPEPVGAAWWRHLGRDDPGFGFVDEATPEITIGVVETARRRGVGRLLLEALIAEAECRRLPALSLSVEPDNFAMRLYERVGFRPAGASGGAVTMVLTLADHA